jgi:hypothetical protein
MPKAQLVGCGEAFCEVSPTRGGRGRGSVGHGYGGEGARFDSGGLEGLPDDMPMASGAPSREFRTTPP